MTFQQPVILGAGLLGGSLTLCLQQRVGDTRLWARRAATVAQAQELGIAGATANLTTAVAGADLLILAVPVGAMPGLLRQAITAGLPQTALITDVGSVKHSVHRELRDLLRDEGRHFIGSHPMAGAEVQGIAAARADLFQGATCLLTNDEHVAEDRAEALEALWRELGCHTAWMSAAEHDALVARISHLPHIMAAATALGALNPPQDMRYAGGGLRDTTRIAAGSPEMWAEILQENRDEIIPCVEQACDSLREMLAKLKQADHEGTRNWLQAASQLLHRGQAAVNHDHPSAS